MTNDSAPVAASVAAGALAAFLTEAGLTAPDLGYAALGTGMGTVSTRALPRLHAFFLFAALTVVSALLARWCAQTYFPDGHLASKALAAIFGLVSYGVRAQLLTSLPDIWGSLLRRVGVTNKEGGQ